MSQRIFCLFLVTTLVLTGCSSIKTFVETPPDASITGSTYAFVPLPEGELDQASVILYDEIRRRISADLQQSGYTVDTEAPQLLVAFNVLTEEQRKEVTRSSDPYGSYDHLWMNAYSRGWWPPMDRSRYKEISIEKTGTLIVDVVDVSEKKLLWRGLGTGPVNDPDERFETTYKIVDKLFKKFPVATVASNAR